jgi:peroxiredoxin
MQRLGVIALVLALVFGAVWMDRDRHDPVPPYGIVPQPATTTVPVLDSAPTAGDPAPNFRLLATNGDVVELADLRGQPLVIHFWTTWCLECAPELSALQQAESDQGIQVVGIAVGETSDRVDQAADTGGASYPMLLDRDKEVSHYYGVWDYPATLVIDADGVIGSVTMGPISPEDLQRQLDSVLET